MEDENYEDECAGMFDNDDDADAAYVAASKSKFTQRDGDFDEDELDYDAGDKLIEASENLNALVNIIYDLPPMLLTALSKASGTDKSDLTFWVEVCDLAEDHSVPYPNLLSYFMIDRIAKEARRCLNHLIWIPEEVPVEAEDDYIRCRLWATGDYSIKQDENGFIVREVDLTKVRAMRASRAIIHQNLLFNVIADTKIETVQKGRFKQKKDTATANLKFAYKPTMNDHKASPILFPLKDGIVRNTMPTYFERVIPVVKQSHAMCHHHYVLMKKPKMPRFPIPIIIDPITEKHVLTLERWVGVADRKLIHPANFCKRVAFDGVTPIDHARVVAAMLFAVSRPNESIGGKLTDIGAWVENFGTKVINWWSTGKMFIPRTVSQWQKIYYCSDNEQYEKADILCNPVASRDNIKVYGARVYCVSPFDAATIDAILKSIGSRPCQLYITMGPTPVLWLIKKMPVGDEKMPGLINPGTLSTLMPSMPMIVERLAFRHFEMNMRGLDIVYCHQVLFSTTKNPVGRDVPSLVFSAIDLQLPQFKWVGKEESSKPAPKPMGEFMDFT